MNKPTKKDRELAKKTLLNNYCGGDDAANGKSLTNAFAQLLADQRAEIERKGSRVFCENCEFELILVKNSNPFNLAGRYCPYCSQLGKLKFKKL